MVSEASYRVAEIAGFLVVTPEGEELGILVDVLPTGSNDVFVVGEGAKEILIPALKTVVVDIDKNTRRITVVLPKGLRESQRA
jgi:16S rRNA processing protein RimM